MTFLTIIPKFLNCFFVLSLLVLLLGVAQKYEDIRTYVEHLGILTVDNWCLDANDQLQCRVDEAHGKIEKFDPNSQKLQPFIGKK